MFRHAVRGAVLCGGHMLICRVKGAHSFLPGGAVEPGEGARAALARELHEELALTAVTVGRFLGVVENRFWDDNGGRQRHGIDHVFAVRAGGLRSTQAPVSREPHLEFCWVPATAAALRRSGVLPEAMQRLVPTALHGVSAVGQQHGVKGEAWGRPCPLGRSGVERFRRSAAAPEGVDPRSRG